VFLFGFVRGVVIESSGLISEKKYSPAPYLTKFLVLNLPYA